MKFLFSIYLACLLCHSTVAQIKYQGVEFHLFHKSFPQLTFPFELDEKAVVQKTIHEDYEPIEQLYAEMFLGITYRPLVEGVEAVPEKVPHLVGSFVCHTYWNVLIYYWFPFPASKEANDNFELVIFDRQGGKVASKILAGVWGDTKQFATLKKVGKDIIIDITLINHTHTETFSYKITDSAQIIRLP